MSERYIVVRNWERFQHKDVWRKSGGRPPWIKNYTALLSDDDYLSLSCSQRGLLHGLWLMYASAGRALHEDTTRRLLSTNKAESRHFLSNLESLNHAGFIEFVSHPISAPVAPRVEESREEPPSIPPASNPLLEEPRAERSQQRGKGWVENLNAYTGCRYVRGEYAMTAVYDVLGTEPPPQGWPHARPTRDEILAAIRERHVA